MEITDTNSYSGTITHPHVATIAMDPADWTKFQSTYDGQPEVFQLGVDRTRPDHWIVYTACASRAVADLLESNW